MSEGPADAEAVFRSAGRPERVWPWAVAVAVLYVLASCWGFTRAFGSTGRDAHVQATPSLWVLLGVVAVVVLAWVLGRAESRAGGSPWRWPRTGRRVLAVAAVALPVLAFGVAPVAAITTVDAGRTDVAAPVTWLVGVHVDLR